MIPSAVNRYFTIDDGVKSARVLGEELVDVSGRRILCTVLEVTYEHPANAQQEFSPTTMWIDRARSIVLRESLTVSANNPQGGGPMKLAQTTHFQVVELDAPLPEGTFAFDPPSGAKEVAQIGPQESAQRSDLEGKPAPDFTLTDMAGKPVKLSSLRGKVVLLDFWATWCGPCRIEMPRVQKLHRDYRAKGLAVYGVNVGETATKVRPYLTKNGYTFPMLLDREKTVMEKYGVSGIPTLVIVDRKGMVHSYFVGVREDSVLRNAIASLGVR
jgi:peroxiredoxin